MIDLESARALLDMGKRIGGGHRAEEQLKGAVAIHNILRKHRRAYLADEVGMGKTYVALGAIALFRHFEPNFRVLVIAPRENIQSKWRKELTNFVAHNVRFADLRMAAPGGRLARAVASCDNLIELVKETGVDPNRDFFARMSSFSLGLSKNGDDWKKQRDKLRHQLPWLRDEAFDLRNKDEFKKNFARAVCCALPKFDLVVVDEAHNLKHGFHRSVSARNQMLAAAFGRYADGDAPDQRWFPGYGPRAERVLFLSATPLEESYRQLWNQLDIFGRAEGLDELKSEDTAEASKKALVAEFLVRRVTSIPLAGIDHTKNMYRREWRAGGVTAHDEPIRVVDPRQRLIVALVQKKVSELLGGKRFGYSFQVGMLASFESFLETARLKRDGEEVPTFDDADQAEKSDERDGIDVRDVNRLAGDYQKTFGREMPHPKMDAVVESLANAWVTGEKSLIFVRRVASVTELKKKLDERYDDWLTSTLAARLPAPLAAELGNIVKRYKKERAAAPEAADLPGAPPIDDVEVDLSDEGGDETFFAWFFRGKGPKGLVSGANIQGRFIQASGPYATFFSDNHVMFLLGARPGEVAVALGEALRLSPEQLSVELRRKAAAYITSRAKVVTRSARMEAAQAAALELLRASSLGELARRAEIIWQERYQSSLAREPAKEAPPEIQAALETDTFFNRLRLAEHTALRESIWPALSDSSDEAIYRAEFRELELRAQFLSTAARLGHAFIDLYLTMVAGRATFAVEAGGDIDADVALEGHGAAQDMVGNYLRVLDAQRRSPTSYGAWRELSDISQNFHLILDVNASDAKTAPLAEMSRSVASLLRRQQPVGGMSGQVNQTLVRQFRMPGYPFVLVTTDLLQEGEDLHTFCSSVHHYGIAWTSSSMEQRIGRIDRVRSQSERRLSGRSSTPEGNEWLQVYYPYLDDTVEVLQVERVLDRVNTFLRLMHEGLAGPEKEQRKIDVARDMLAPRKNIAAFREPLRSAFPLPGWAATGEFKKSPISRGDSDALLARFHSWAAPAEGDLQVEWKAHPTPGCRLGTAKLANGRIQPFTLVLRADHGLAVMRCISPVGRTDPEADSNAIAELASRGSSRLGAILTKETRSYDLTVEDDVLLAGPQNDAARLTLLIGRVVTQADRMEREHFEDKRDAMLTEFEANLVQEASHGN